MRAELRSSNPATNTLVILRAARAVLRRRGVSFYPGLRAFYEHGQWWVEHPRSGAVWSVVDAEGGGAVDGFDFEPISGEAV